MYDKYSKVVKCLPLNKQTSVFSLFALGLVFLMASFLALPVLSQSDSSNSKPGNLHVSVTGGAVTLTWDAPSSDAESITGYQILRHRPYQGERRLIVMVANTNSTDTTYADFTATEAGVRYGYRVKAIRNGTVSRFSNHARIDLDKNLGRSPANLNVSIVNGSVTLFWDAPFKNTESVTGYEILRRRPTNGENTLMTYVENTGSNATVYADFNATEAGVRYVYRVKAISNDTRSGRSNYARIDLNETLTPPAQQNEIVARGGERNVSSQPQKTNLTFVGESEPDTPRISQRQVSETTCDVNGLLNRHLPVPLNVMAEIGPNGKATITWEHPTGRSPGTDTYTLTHQTAWSMSGPPAGHEGMYGWQTAGTTPLVAVNKVGSSTSHTFDDNLMPGNEYRFYVHLQRNTMCSRPNGISLWGAKNSDSDPDAVEFNSVTKNGPNSVTLNWNSVTDADGYEIWRAGSDNTFTQVGNGERCVELNASGLNNSEEYVQHCKNRVLVGDTGSTSTSYVDNTVEPGKFYLYVVFPRSGDQYILRRDLEHKQRRDLNSPENSGMKT